MVEQKPELKKIRGDGVELCLAEWPGEGPPILAVHGLTANCRAWDSLARKLSPGRRILAPDLRGRGLSGRPRSGYSVEHHVRDLVAVLDHLHLNRAVVMGHSLGATIAVVMAAEHPFRVDRLILLDGAGKLPKAQMAKVVEGIKPSLERLGKTFPSFPAYLGTMKRAPFFHPWNHDLETYFQHEIEEVEDGVRSRVHPDAIRRELEQLLRFDIAPFFSRVRCRTLILRALRGMLKEDDILLPNPAAARMLHDIRSAMLVDVEKANHYSILFHPQPVRDEAIKAFLDSP